MHLLVIEDERALCETIVRSLRRLAYSVDYCYDGEKALELLGVERYDLVLLDLNLPKKDGMTVLRTLRQTDRETRVLILSARGEVEDKVEGLDAGANDYLAKPFHLAELEARIRALLRRGRTQESAQGGELRVDDVCIDVAGHRVTRQGREVKVSPTGFRILCELARRAPALVRREELERRLWGDDLPGGSALRTHIHELRQHLDKPFGSPVLHTISHVGYRLGREEEPGA